MNRTDLLGRSMLPGSRNLLHSGYPTAKIVYGNGQVRQLEGYATVLSDHETAAGSDGLFGSGHAVMWTER